MDNEQQKEPVWQDVAMAEARMIGQQLREQYNMQPSPEMWQDGEGVWHAGEVTPPPTVHNIDALAITGKQSIVY